MGDESQLPTNRFQVDLLTADNYFIWSNDLEILLRGKGLWGYVNGDITDPIDLSNNEGGVSADRAKFKQKMDLALANIFMTINASCKASVITLRDPKEVWDKLKEMYQTVSETAIDAKLMKFQQMEMTKGETVIEFANRIESIVNELAAVGHIIREMEKKRAILRGLTTDFAVAAQVIRTGTKKYSEAVADLVIFECTLQEKNQPTALIASSHQGTARNVSCSHCGRPGHNIERCWHNPNGRNYRRTMQKPGSKSHHRNESPNRKSNKKQKERTHEDGNSQKKEDFMGKGNEYSDESEGSLALTVIQKVLTANEKNSKWMVDSGCSAHMTNEISHFTKYTNRKSQVQVGNQEFMESEGYGTVDIWTVSDGKTQKVTLHDVVYAPNILYNLLSVSKARKNGCKLTIDDENEKNRGILRIINKRYNKVLLTAMETPEGLYEALLKPGPHVTEKAYIAKDFESSLWHQRLGHMSEATIQKSINMVRGITRKSQGGYEETNCRTCVLGKSCRKSRSKRSKETTAVLEPLERTFTDVVGPITPPSISGARYFITLMDDYSGYSLLRFIRRKSQATETIQEMVNELETSFNSNIQMLKFINRKRVKWMRSDGGGEYLSRQLQTWFSQKGIRHESTTAYSPESNGKAERLNRTLLDSARCMMQNLENLNACDLWAEAINTANFIRNRLFTKSCQLDMTPFQTVFHSKPNLSHIRIFGCKAFVHKPKQRRTDKMETRAEEGVLVGYDRGDAYRILLKNSKAVVISKDVSFFELEKPRSRDTDKRTAGMFFELEDDLDEFHIDENMDQFSGPVNNSEIAEAPVTMGHNIEESDSIDDLTYHPGIRRTTRRTAGVPPERYGSDVVCLVTDSTLNADNVNVPVSYNAALNCGQSMAWWRAMEDEMAALSKNETWTLVPLPMGRKPIKTKWVYDIKTDEKDSIVRYKARLVARGFTQQWGVDYIEVFSPVVRYSTVRFFLALVAHNNWKRVKLDVRSAFLNAELDEEIYVEQPRGFEKPGQEHLVCFLKKALYGLKQASRAWHQLLKSFLITMGLRPSLADPALYALNDGSVTVVLIVYVDDIQMASNSAKVLTEFVRKLSERFPTHVETVNKFLGITLKESNDCIKIHHASLIEKMLRFFKMEDCNPTSVPLPLGTDLSTSMEDKKCDSDTTYHKPFSQLVGCLLHLSNTTRPDIAYTAGYLARFMHTPSEGLWRAGKHVLRYLKGTKHLGLRYVKGSGGATLHGYSDSDWGQERPSRKSISGYVFMYNGAAISWRSKRQSIVAQSSLQAEYIALAFAIREALWFQKFSDIGLLSEADFPMMIREDNRGCISVAHNDVVNDRTKHIDIKYQLVVDHVRKGNIALEYTPTKRMTADIMTKTFSARRHLYLISKLGMLV